VGKRKAHARRDVDGRALTLHLRYAAADIDKMNEWLRSHDDLHNDIFQAKRGKTLDMELAIRAIAGQRYRAEKANMEGPMAHMREKRLGWRYFGLVRGDTYTPPRLGEYLKALEGGRNVIPLLRSYSLGIKLKCSQVRTFHYQAEHKQAGYGHYRIRPMRVFLGAISLAQDLDVELNTDDIALTVFRFVPPSQCEPVTERWLLDDACEFLKRKSAKQVSYEERFRSLTTQAFSEVGRSSFTRDEFRKKCLNAANDVWNWIILSHKLGLIDRRTTTPQRWSSTKLRYHRTAQRDYDIVSLTDLGRSALLEMEKAIPIWYDDVVAATSSPNEKKALLIILGDLGAKRRVRSSSISARLFTIIAGLGVKLTSNLQSEQPVVFTPPYDIPPVK